MMTDCSTLSIEDPGMHETYWDGEDPGGILPGLIVKEEPAYV